MERWLDVPGYEGHYQVSDHGRIRSLARCRPNPLKGKKQICQVEKEMRPLANMNGYQFIYLKRNGDRTKYYMHRLVAHVFIPNPDEKPIVNHKNCDRSDNRVANLEWMTGSENTLHGYAMKKERQIAATEEYIFKEEDLPF